MWILYSGSKCIYWHGCILQSVLHDILYSNNCIWMAICSTGVNLYILTIITCYMLFILPEKQFNNSYLTEKQYLVEFINNKPVRNKSIPIRLNMMNNRKRSIKTINDYMNIKKQKHSNPYISTYKSNLSLQTKSLSNIFTNNLKQSHNSQSIITKQLSSSLLSNKNDINEPYFDPNQSVYITSIINNTARIPCKVKNIDFSSTVMSWWKEDLPTPLTVGNEISLPRYEIDRTDPGSWTLMIFHVTETDSGTYICQINLATIKEKFFYLKVIAQKNEPDMTKLNDEYVKEEIVQNTLWRASSKQKSVHIFNNPGQNHHLTCLVQFHHPTTTSSIHWYYNGNRIYPKLENNYLKIKELYVDIQTKWINRTTQMSRLKIGRLTKNNSGIWTCRKVPGTNLESLEESSLDLQKTNIKTEPKELYDTFNDNTGKSLETRLLPLHIYTYFMYFYIFYTILYYSYV
ncbi:unnamed protein product [Schistosoma mattheei]|uniref:Ig-like domain-containing protein n=1 Tax=Schistosoma mattheei TaxID=31246 RepID=A0AA85AWP9_9TREM|nr:unnamed protein product [Schistosoma mattheei]